jgi:hypothetical protein
MRFRRTGGLIDWTREGVLGFLGTLLRRDGRWLEGELPDAFPEALPWSLEDIDDSVLAFRTNELSPIALRSPAAELRRVTPDARAGVLVRYGDEQRRSMTHSQLVHLHTGRPIPTRYDSLLHRAAAIAHHEGELTIAVNGQVLRGGRRLASYRGLAHATAPFRNSRPVASLDEHGAFFAWCSASALSLVLVDLSGGRERRLPLEGLRRPLAPLEEVDLSPRAAASLLGAIGAAPLAPVHPEALAALLTDDEHRDELVRRLDDIHEALATWRLWPCLSTGR